MRQKLNRIVLMLLVLTIFVSCLTPMASAASGSSMTTADMKTVFNSAKLYPQRTGYAEIDNAIDKILAPYKNSDTYTKMQALYDWAVRNIRYSWEPYSKKSAPAYEYFTPKYNLTIEKGLQPSVPEDMINRTYHCLTAKKGVCYDYAITYAIMARYIGLDAYVHTGYYTLESWAGRGACHHGWTEIVVNGQTYIFDLQREYRFCQYKTNVTHDFFGIPLANGWRYSQETLKNVPRDASMLSVSAHRHHNVTVSALVSPSGSIQGTGTYQDCAEVTLTSSTSNPVVAWYNTYGEKLSTSPSYKFVPNGDVTVIAMFSGDRYADVSTAAWYGSDILEATDLGIVKGTTDVTFAPNENLTRAMVAAYLARVSGDDITAAAASPFADVPQSQWYADSIDWAYANNVVKGVSATLFAPDKSVTREDFITMIIRYLANEGITAETGAGLTYADAGKISSYAANAIQQAQALELLTGYPDGTVRPKDNISRAEGITLIMRMVRCIENSLPETEAEAA